VHDPGAAMLGGVAGHAGLFSNAYDLSVIMQMLLQEGSFGGTQYLRPETVRQFTSAPFAASGNRRGIGFDKPPLIPIPDGPVCVSASLKSFGHSGFTGTYAWADPENKLVYIFLSNRVYPDAGNQELSRLNIRTNIHQAAYDLLKKFQVK
jgi:CubicO group peptidase (beta-lactamase class C family)